MALGTPYTTTSAGYAGSMSVTSAALSNAVGAGDAHRVWVATNSGTISGVTDSGGSNTYTLVSSNTTQTSKIYEFVALNCSALTTSATLSFTGSSGTGTRAMISRGCSGVAHSGGTVSGTATDIVQTSVSSSSGSTPSIPVTGTTASLAQASEWAACGVASGTAGGVPGTGSMTGVSWVASDQNAAGVVLTVGDLITTATTGIQAVLTLAASTNYGMTLSTMLPVATVAGAVATIALAAPVGSVSAGATVAGAVATITLTAPAGSIATGQSVAGVTALISLSAPAGSIAYGNTVAGVVSAINVAAPAGTVKAGATIAGLVASVSLTAPAGTAAAGVSVSGLVATIALTAPAGTASVSATIAGLVASVSLTAPAGTLHYGNTVAGAVALITVLAPVGGVQSVVPVVTPDPLEANLIPIEDATFSGGYLTGNWAVTSGNGSLSVDTTQGFAGVNCLKVTCTSTGTVTFTYTPALPVAPPYGVAWGLHCTSTHAFPLTATVSTYDASNTETNTSTDTVTMAPTWLPLAGSTGSNVALSGGPTTHCQISFSCPMTNGAGLRVDLVGVFRANGQVLIDWLNNSYGATPAGGNNFADMTGFTRLADGITWSRGRQDNISDVQPGQATFNLRNDTGFFTPGCNVSPWYGYVTLGRRVQINATDQTGAWHTRFDGAIAEIDYAVDVTGGTNTATVACADIIAPLNRSDDLFCWTKEIVLNNNPAYHWTLDDSGVTGQALETSGNGGPALVAVSYGNGGSVGTLTWQGGAGGVETMADKIPLYPAVFTTPLVSPYWKPALVPAATGVYNGQLGIALLAPLPLQSTNSTSLNYTFEAWCTLDPTWQQLPTGHSDGTSVLFALGNTRTQQSAQLAINNASGVAFSYWNQPPAFDNVAPIHTFGGGSFTGLDLVTQPHHLVVTVAGGVSGSTVAVWVDGVTSGTTTLPANFQFNQINVGAAFGGGGGFYGNISLMSIYDYELSPTQIAADFAAGQSGMWRATTDNTICTLANVAGIPSYWSNLTSGSDGLTLGDYFDVTGSNVLAAMQVYEQAERGFLFVNALGQLTFHTRDWRMGYGAPDVTLPSGTYQPDLGYEVVDQYLVNEAAVASQLFSSSQSSINTVSQSAYGDYPSGTKDSPNQVPYLTWSEGYAEAAAPGLSYWSQPYMDDSNMWQSNTESTPYFKCGKLTVDLLALNEKANDLYISSLYGVDIDNMLTLSGGAPVSFPTDAGALDYFIEGISETLSVAARAITFYTSPATPQRAWRPGDATYGVLGTTARIGISGVDSHAVQPLGKNPSSDAGPPYWPPVFATAMNNPAANGHGFVGASDLRGIAATFTSCLSPPLLIVGQSLTTQSISNMSGSFGVLNWDTVYVDTATGMGVVPNWPNWYCVMRAGFYDINGSVIWTDSTNGTGTRLAQLVIAEQACAGVILTGSSTPYLANEASFVAGQVGSNSSSTNNITQFETRSYLGVGDMIGVAVYNDGGATDSTGTNYGGSMLSLRFAGISTTNDQFGNVAP